jgi:acetyl-CoA carboxylase biotin carboxyl carrier protein
MIDLEFLRGLIGAVDESGIDSLEISRGGTRIRISKTPPPAPVHAAAPAAAAPAHLQMPPAHHLGVPQAAAPAAAGAAAAPAPAAAAPAGPALVEITSPMVGTFYRSPAPEAPSYVEVGSRVAKGQTLCILEAMKLMNELESDVAGVVREICVDNGEPVEYGQVLFRIEPAE